MNNPKLRFKADDGSEFPEWEEAEIGEICAINPKTGEVEDEFLYMDLGSVDHGDWEEPEVMIKSKAPSRAQRVARVGDVFFQSVRPYNQGHFHYSEKKDKQVVASTGYIQIRMKNCDSGFIYYILYDAHFNQEVSIRCTGSNYPAINADDFSEIVIAYPSIEEQKKIASFLSTIDDIINQTQSELTAWEERKKGVMQKIFNREVRFKADDGSEFPEWEEKRLGDLCSMITKGTTPKEYSVNHEVNFVKIESIENGRINIDKCGSISKKIHFTDLARSILVEGDILFAIAGSLGRIVLVTKNILPANTNQALCIIRLRDITMNKYIFGVLDSELMARYIRKCCTIGAQPNLSLEQMADFKFPLPCSEEQKKIADCLSSLDDVINQIQAELSAWKEFKKGLLQQMFV